MKTFLFSALLLPLSILAQTVSLKNHLRILSLGDSYTIGQSVAVYERWPLQLSDSLFAEMEVVTDTMRIIATTGWRTDDLLDAIKGQDLEKQNYNLVSLLIGVNNQYQVTPFNQYVVEFSALLDSAIRYAGGDKSHVFVVSIPDYAYTPFGQLSPNPSQISSQLDQYNAYNKHVTDSAGIAYIDITPISREGLMKPTYVASDGLHPSGVQYSKWVGLILTKMHKEILTGISTQQVDDLNVFMYPNPAKEIVTIHAPAKCLVQVYDARGALVFEKSDVQSPFKLNVSGFSKGLYALRITYGISTFAKKLVIE